MDKIVTLKEIYDEAVACKSSLENQANGIGRNVMVYLHWSAGLYHQIWQDYHINIDDKGNCHMTGDFDDIKYHTYKRNTGSIGVSLCACYGAELNGSPSNPKPMLGEYAPTSAQIEKMAQVIAVLALALDLYGSYGELLKERVWTHYEAAVKDDYAPWGWDPDCRWDLSVLTDDGVYGEGGDTLRGKAIWYYNIYKEQGIPEEYLGD